MDNGRLFMVGGSRERIISMAQQLAWLAAVCQTASRGGAYSRINFTIREGSTPAFNIRVFKEPVPNTEEGCCWTALMGESALVTGFPIRDRPENLRGLESWLDVLAGLIGIQQAVTYRGGYVLKGRHHALIPIEKVRDSVQWHLVDESPRRLLWTDIDKHCPNRLLGTNPNDLEALMSARAMLGWCGVVENVIGKAISHSTICFSSEMLTSCYNSPATHEFQYDQVKYSDAKPASRSSARISDLTIGFSHFLRATVKVSFGHHQGVSLQQRSDHYETILEDAADLNIFLHDTKRKCSIHTSGERLILQAILHANHYSPFIVDGRPVDLRPLAIGDNLRSEMMSRANIVLRKGPMMNRTATEGTVTFKNKVQELYERLDRMQADAPDKPILRLPTEASRTLVGWEYLELVKRAKLMSAKKTVLQGTCGQWPSFAMDPDIRGIFLFGHDFGDLLRPVGDVCPLYKSIPEGLDFLGLMVEDLKTLCKDRGSWPDPEQITSSGWVLHRSGLLFDSCVDSSRCNRVQTFLNPFSTKLPWFSNIPSVPLGSLEPKGAIIIGQPGVGVGNNGQHVNIQLPARAAGHTLNGTTRVVRS